MLTSNTGAFNSCLLSVWQLSPIDVQSNRILVFTQLIGKVKRLYEQCERPGFASAPTHPRCLMHQGPLAAAHYYYLFLRGLYRCFSGSQWVTAALSELFLYVSISDVNASQSRAWVNQQPSYNRGETQSQKLRGAGTGQGRGVFCFSLSGPIIATAKVCFLQL